MERYIVKGGNPLIGEVEISGAKNAALPILAAAIMTDEAVIIDNLPDVKDVNVLIDSISSIGAVVTRIDRHSVKINGGTINSVCADNEFIKKMRASYYLLGALLGKCNRAEVSMPGGCNLGTRAIDQHLKGLKLLGADVRIDYGRIIANAEELKGNSVFFDTVTVGATINIMLAATLAKGTTVLENVAKEPHIVDVANMLNSMGANIKGAGTDVIRIKGVEKLHGTEYSVIPDQIEAGTFMCAAAVTKGNILVKNVIPKHLEAITAKLYEIGCSVEEYDDAVRVIGNGRLSNTQIKTLPYPGFPTDMQPQMTVTLASAKGTSTVIESIFDSRFKYADELTLMGANIKVEGNVAIIEGVESLKGAQVNALDLRAGVALVLAGLGAQGFTVIEDIHYIQRGYEDLSMKISKLGGIISVVNDEKEIQKFKLKVG